MLRSLLRRTALTFALSTALVTATPALARDPGGRMPDPEQMRDRAEHVFEAVDATPRQRMEAWSLLDSAIAEMQAYRERGRALRERFMNAFAANEIDRREVGSARSELVDLFDRATDRGFELLVGIAEVFTPEQRQQMRELRRTHGDSGQGRRGYRAGDTVPL